ncbi:hypothetical protein D3C72_1235930 [compost metagenome]
MKKLVRAQAGVRLERIDHLAARQKRAVCFKLTSHRNTPERLIADEAEAQRAFAREVEASLEDEVVKGLIRRGVVEL